MADIYYNLLNKIYKKTNGEGFYSFGDFFSKENRINYNRLGELEEKKLVILKIPDKTYYVNSKNKPHLKVPAGKGNLEAKITFDGINYLKVEKRQERSSGNKISKAALIKILLTIIGILVAIITFLLSS